MRGWAGYPPWEASRKCRWCACAILLIQGRAMPVPNCGSKGGVCSLFSVPWSHVGDKRCPAAHHQAKRICSGTRCLLWGPALETSWNSLPSWEARKWMLLPGATKCFPQWHSARWWGGRRWWAPWGSEHTQLLTAGHCHEQLDARDTRPFRTAWASGNESLVGTVCLGARTAVEKGCRQTLYQENQFIPLSAVHSPGD